MSRELLYSELRLLLLLWMQCLMGMMFGFAHKTDTSQQNILVCVPIIFIIFAISSSALWLSGEFYLWLVSHLPEVQQTSWQHQLRMARNLNPGFLCKTLHWIEVEVETWSASSEMFQTWILLQQTTASIKFNKLIEAIVQHDVHWQGLIDGG